MAQEYERIKGAYLVQEDVATLTYENFLNLPQITINKLVQRVTDLNDQGILNGLWITNRQAVAPTVAPSTITAQQVLDIVTKAVAPMAKLVPLVCNLTIESNNLWTNTQIADSVTDRDEDFRKRLVSHLGYGITGKGRKRKRKEAIMYKCMVSGLEGTAEDVQAAHIVPAKSSLKKLAYIGMTSDNVSDVRNGLLLASEIHRAFDNLQVSFVKTNPLTQQLYFKIWDSSCRDITILGTRKNIGDLDGAELNLGCHMPFKRALSYHAYTAYLKFKFVLTHDLPVEYGSENESRYYDERKLMKEAVIRDMRDELED